MGMFLTLGLASTLFGPMTNVAAGPTFVFAMTRWPSMFSVRIGVSASLLHVGFLAPTARATAAGATTAVTPVQFLLLEVLQPLILSEVEFIITIPIANGDPIILDSL
jgi:hypothetical protein